MRMPALNQEKNMTLLTQVRSQGRSGGKERFPEEVTLELTVEERRD